MSGKTTITLEDIAKAWEGWAVDQRMELLRWVNAHCAHSF
jgi:hypothetical protein